MIYFDVTIGEPTILPLDDAVGIKRIVILNNGDPNSAIGNSTGWVMIETSPFVNVNYFEQREAT